MPGEVLVRVAAVLALGAAVVTAASFQADRNAAPATAWLGLVATAVSAALLLANRRVLLPVAFTMVLAFLLAVYLPHAGATLLAALAVLLAAALAVAAAEIACGREAPGVLPWLGVAFAAQVVVHADRLWLGPFTGAAFAEMVALPTVAAVALSTIARRAGPLLALAAGGTALAAGPGFGLATVATLALSAALALGSPAWVRSAPLLAALPAFGHEPSWAATALLGLAAASLSPRLAPARGVLAGVILGTLLAAALPWQRRQPIATLLGAVSRAPFAALEEPLAHGSRTLSAEAPALAWPLSGEPLRVLVIDSFLSEGVALDCGSAVARVRLHAPGRPPVERTLVVGGGTGEWASARSDVVNQLACRELVPQSLWLPSQGRFFGRTFRARFQLESPVAAESVEIERLPGLAPQVRLHLLRVATER